MGDWSSACPEFWAETASGYCVAPPQYRFEGCAKMISVGSSSTERQNVAAACHVKWPCNSRCGEDYAQVCPTGWLQNSDGSCRAPTKMPQAYAGPCEPVVTFANVSTKDSVEVQTVRVQSAGFLWERLHRIALVLLTQDHVGPWLQCKTFTDLAIQLSERFATQRWLYHLVE